MGRKKLFCEISPLAYAISLRKEILKRHIKNFLSKEKFADRHDSEQLPVVVSACSNGMIKRGPGIDLRLQHNKADNIRLACSKINGVLVRPGETFSFWKHVGKTSRRNGFADGRVIINGKLVSGVGGGLCNLANSIHLLAIHSPMTVTELHHHSDALAPDPQGIRVPYSAGTSVNYNFLDFRFRNDTDRPIQICAICDGDELKVEMRTTHEYPYTYRIAEEGHHFHKEANGKYYRNSKIYKETLDRATGKLIERELKWNNHSKVLFDYSLIPQDQIN